MPSSEEIYEAKAQVREWAIEALMKDGHPRKSAEMIADRMNYDERIKYAEKVHGPIYRGAYSPF